MTLHPIGQFVKTITNGSHLALQVFVILLFINFNTRLSMKIHLFARNRTTKLLVWTLCAALIALFIQLGSGVAAQFTAKSDTLELLTNISPTTQKVDTGIFAMNVYNLDASSSTYYLDFYVWFKWKGEIDPTEKLEFSNGVEDWGMSKEVLYEQPEKLPDGNLYQVLRVEGRFLQPFALARYPLDQQNLQLSLENSVYTSDQLVYIADKKQSGYSDSLSIPGWKIQAFELSNLVRGYTTNFGDPRSDSTSNQYSVLQYSLAVSRPVSFFIWKLLLPLIIVIVASWGSLLLDPQKVDSRIIIPVTTLLTTVFLQQSYSASLPDLGYLVLLDKIYVIAYIIIIVSILEAIVTADWIKDEKPASYARVARLDRTLLITQTATLFIGVAILILLS